jgi:hypothetical protein
MADGETSAKAAKTGGSDVLGVLQISIVYGVNRDIIHDKRKPPEIFRIR